MRRTGNGSGRGKRYGMSKGCEKEDSKGMARDIEIELMRGGMGTKRDLMELIGSMVGRTKMILSRVEKRRIQSMRAAR